MGNRREVQGNHWKENYLTTQRLWSADSSPLTAAAPWVVRVLVWSQLNSPMLLAKCFETTLPVCEVGLKPKDPISWWLMVCLVVSKSTCPCTLPHDVVRVVHKCVQTKTSKCVSLPRRTAPLASYPKTRKRQTSTNGVSNENTKLIFEAL